MVRSVSFSQSGKIKKKSIAYRYFHSYLVTHEFLIILNLTDNTILQKYKSEDIYDALSEGNFKVNMMILDPKKKAIGHIQFNLKQPNASKLRNELKIISNCYRPVYGFDYQLIDNKNNLI